MLVVVLPLLLSIVVADVQACILGTQTGCSTGVAIGLTKQIAAQLTSMGYTFKTLNSTATRCSPPCVNMLQASAADSLARVAGAKHDYITLYVSQSNVADTCRASAWRSSAQQYLLYSWYTKGICGIKLAAKPGTSNHEGGRAVDTSNYNYWKTSLEAGGWKWFGSGDPVHFSYVSAPDVAKQNLIAFQKLWNQHNSNKIAEDGVYGPATANALYNAPCGGW